MIDSNDKRKGLLSFVLQSSHVIERCRNKTPSTRIRFCENATFSLRIGLPSTYMVNYNNIQLLHYWVSSVTGLLQNEKPS